MKWSIVGAVLALVALSGCASSGANVVSSDDSFERRLQPPLFQTESPHDEGKCTKAGSKVGSIVRVNGREYVMVAEGFPAPGAGQVAANVIGIAAAMLGGFGTTRQRVCRNKAFPVEATSRPLDTFSAEERKVLDERRARDSENR